MPTATTISTSRKCLIRAGAALLLLAAAAGRAGAAESALQPYVAEYKVEISVLGGVLETELRKTADGYRASHTVRATGLSRLLAGGSIADIAEFERVDDYLRPSRFMTDDTVTRDGTRADISFDWTAGEARGTLDGKPYAKPVDESIHDRTSIQYQLMLDLMNGGTDGEYELFEPDETKNLEVRIVGEREISVPFGDFTAIGVQHRTRDSKRITTLWCVEELGYLPVVIEQHRKGKLRMRATLRRYEAVDA